MRARYAALGHLACNRCLQNVQKPMPLIQFVPLELNKVCPRPEHVPHLVLQVDAVKEETVETVDLYKQLHAQCDEEAPQTQHKAFAHLRLSMHARLEAIKGFLDRQRAIRFFGLAMP